MRCGILIKANKIKTTAQLGEIKSELPIWGSWGLKNLPKLKLTIPLIMRFLVLGKSRMFTSNKFIHYCKLFT